MLSPQLCQRPPASAMSIGGRQLECPLYNHSRRRQPLLVQSPARCPVPLEPHSVRTAVVVEMGRRSDKIALRKGKSDMKKAKLYGRVGKRIVQYVKAGGADPVVNTRLSDLLKQANSLGVPKDIVERNLKKATDKTQADFQEVVYEAYGPAGTGFIIECLTDNVNRSAGEVKSVINKMGCKVAEPGSVMFNFARVGRMVVDSTTEDACFEAAMEAGAEDVVPVPPEEEGQESTSVRVYVPADQLFAAQNKLRELNLSVNPEECELVYKAAAPIEVDDSAFNLCEQLMDRLLALDDVDAVYTNADGLLT